MNRQFKIYTQKLTTPCTLEMKEALKAYAIKHHDGYESDAIRELIAKGLNEVKK